MLLTGLFRFGNLLLGQHSKSGLWLWAVGSVFRSVANHREGRYWEQEMTKSELILALAASNPHLYQRDVERIVATILEYMSTALENGDRVELRGFGAFSTKRRSARTGRNPRTGVAVDVPEKVVPYFKPGKALRKRLNDK